MAGYDLPGKPLGNMAPNFQCTYLWTGCFLIWGVIFSISAQFVQDNAVKFRRADKKRKERKKKKFVIGGWLKCSLLTKWSIIQPAENNIDHCVSMNRYHQVRKVSYKMLQVVYTLLHIWIRSYICCPYIFMKHKILQHTHQTGRREKWISLAIFCTFYTIVN